MDLTNPLAAVTPTLDAPVLQVLAATTGYCTAGEVHRRAGVGSDAGIRRVLERLSAQGLVTVDRSNRFPLFRLNLEHLAAPHIVAISSLRARVVEHIQDRIAGWAHPPLHAGIFGSFARGEADADSDIDILLVRPPDVTAANDEHWTNDIGLLDTAVRTWTGNDAHVIDVDLGTLTAMLRNDDPLIGSWRADELYLRGERLADLLRRLR